ncbi:hypothetical protein [Massilia violaceinigra]
MPQPQTYMMFGAGLLALALVGAAHRRPASPPKFES